MKMIGLVVCIILWPSFTYTTALVDAYYLPQYGNIYSTAYLATEGFLHMILGFCAAIGTTLGLRILGEKVVL